MYKGEHAGRRPDYIGARSGPNLPLIHQLECLYRTGLGKHYSTLEASAGPYGESSRRSWGFIGVSSPTASVEVARRPLQIACTTTCVMAGGFVLSYPRATCQSWGRARCDLKGVGLVWTSGEVRSLVAERSLALAPPASGSPLVTAVHQKRNAGGCRRIHPNTVLPTKSR